MKLVRSTAEETLRRWFETGLSYNLMLGESSKRTELDEFEQSLDHIDPTCRIYAASVINQAFYPNVDVSETMKWLLTKGYNVVGNKLFCLTLNWPHWSWELLTSTKRSVLAPEKMLSAYYAVRQLLDKPGALDSEIEVEHPTLKVLCDLEQKRKLTSYLVSFHDKQNPDGSTSCCLFAHGYFKEKHKGVQRHILEIAREHSLGNDPLDRVQFALLDGKKYSQWDSTLQALFCYCEEMTPHNFVKHSRDMVPREYLYAVSDANIINNKLEQLSKRQGALTRFIRPLDSDYSQNITYNPLDQLNPELVRKMVVSHYIMFYLSLLHHLSWSVGIRECRDALNKRFPKSNDFKKAWLDINIFRDDVVCDDPLYERILQLLDSDPIGLPYWAYGPNVIPEPLTLLEEYFAPANQQDVLHIDRLNRKYFSIALIIPEFIKIDTSDWLKPPVMLQEGEPLVIHGSSHIELSERLYLAGLAESGGYVDQTLTEDLTMSLESLEKLLMGISYHWHVGMVEDISVSRFHEHLSHFEITEVSTRTLTSRKKRAQDWLELWPDVGLFTRSL